MKNRVSAVSVLALSWMMAGTFASEAQAQTAPAPTPAPAAAGGSTGQAPPATTGQAAAPQSRPPAAATDDPMADEEEVVVVGQRPFGSVNSDIKPEQTLNAGDVRSYGVSSVAELLTELAPQTNAAAGPPVVLLNGKRISGFQEIRDLPPEAIQRVEILPEDVSLAYGYAANQKVVNIVLRRRFNAWTGEIGAGTTTEGGRESGRATANLLQIRGTTRMSLDVTYSAADELLESERDIIPAAPSRPFALAGNVGSAPGATQIDPALSALAGQTVTVAAVPASATSGRPALAAFVPGANAAIVDDLGRYRTLSPATDNLAINAVIARPLSEKVQGSFNARLEFSGSDSLQGLPGLTLLLPAGNPFSPFSGATQVYRYSAADGGLAQSSRSTDLHVGGALNGEIKDWQWTFTTAYDRSSSRSTSERGIDTTALQAALLANDPTVNPFGVLPPQLLTATLTDRARSTTSSLSGDFLLSGSPFRLPAGKATTSITISGAANDFSSRSLRSGVARALDYSRDIGGVKASIDLPITSRRSGFGAAIGDFALNGNAEVQHLSDYGRITTIGYGLRWSPITEIRFIASMTHDTAAPNGQQVNNPLLTTPNVPVFDYRTGSTVFVTQLSGGNPALLASERQRLRLSLTAKPFTDKDLTLTALFTDNRTDNPVGSFPIPTPQVEAAFPGRFTRDAFGTLVQVDTRPVNYLSSRSTSLRYGFNFSVPLKSALQKKVEAWRAAGANPEDRPKELDAMRELFMRERERREGQRGQGGQGGNRGGEQANAQGGSTGDNAPPASEDQARRPDGAPAPDRGPGEGGGFRGGGGGFGGGGGGRGGFGGGGGGFGGRGGGGGGRMQFALFHTIHLNEDIRIAPGLPKLDLLDGAAIGNSGGQPRHEVETQAGYTNNGLGARLSANWRSATRVDGALGTANSTLKFGDLATADLRLFVNFTQMPELIRDYPFLRGSRLTLAVTNILNSKQDVRDASGAVPISYLPDRIDPLGRRVMVSFRKLFF